MAYKKINNIRIEGAYILPRPFRNFSGEPGRYNRKGDRSFVTRIDDADAALRLREDGWNIREYIRKDDPDAEPIYQLQVAVRFNDYPPKIVMVCDDNKIQLDEEMVSELDTAIITNADLDIRPYHWQLDDGREGIKAYLQTGYFTIENQDPFAEKYADTKDYPDAPIEMPF